MSTEDIRNRQYILNVNNLNTNLMIEAGAGSGKTTILVDRIIVQIKETDIKMSELVAITFTEKAADVLKYRFQKKLLKAQKDETDPIKKCRLTEALENVDDIQISTIHAFCNRILNECPFEANLGPGFGVLKNQDEANAKNRFIKAYAKVHKNDISFQCIKRLGLTPLNFAQFFSDLVDEEYSQVEWSTPISNPQNYFNKAITIAESVCNVVKSACDTKGLSYEEIVKETSGVGPHIKDGLRRAYEASVSKQPEELRIAIEKLSSYADKDNAGNDILDIKGSVKKSEQEALYNTVKELVNELGSQNSNLREAILLFNDLYLSMLVPMAEEYRKAAKRNLSNQELLNYACNLLRNSDKAREYLRKQFKFFYVDEYQDTDPVQTEIFLWLVADGDLTGNNITEKIANAKLLPGKICYIGDPKQSIYGFRKADITLYRKVKALVEKDANSELVKLYANFRSNKEICTWIEKTFKNDFEGLKIETDKQPCVEKDYLSGVYCYRYEYTNSSTEDLAYEAEHIAKVIKNLIDSNCKLYSADRVVEEKDFMVLTPKKKHINAVVSALKKYGLKVEVDGESSISTSKEVANLFYILDFVNNPYSSLKFGKLIRFVAREHYIPGKDYSEARKLVLEKDDVDFENNLNDMSLSVKERNLVKMLRKLVRKRHTQKPLILVQTVIEDLVSLVYSDVYDDARVGYVYGQLEQVFEQLRSKPIATLNCVCRELKSILENKELDKELIVRNTSDAVKVMNVHKAKGLEGKVVILAAGRASALKHSSSNLYCTETGSGNMIVSEPKENLFKYDCVHSYSNGFETIDKKKAEAEKEEHKRLLYVAATRAEEALIIPIPYALPSKTEAKGNTIFKTGKEYRKGFWGDLIPQCGEDDRVHNPDDALAKLDLAFAQKPGANAEDKARIRALVYTSYCNNLNMNCKNGYGKPGSIIQEPNRAVTNTNSNIVNTKLVYRDDTAYDAKLEENRRILGENQLGGISVKLISPSSCEEHKYHNTGSVEAGRMKGNLYGLILHKTYELLVNQIMLHKAKGIDYIKANLDDTIDYILPLAAKEGLVQEALTREQCRRILIPEEEIEGVLAKIQSQQIEYVANHLKAELTMRMKEFMDDKEIMDDLLGDLSAVAYTELPFAMYMPDENGIKVFVNGTMDLLIETKDKFIIWDYKSDGMQYLKDSDELESIEDFEKAIGMVYAPQLEMYTKAVKIMVEHDELRKTKAIETKLYHMYRVKKG